MVITLNIFNYIVLDRLCKDVFPSLSSSIGLISKLLVI